MLDEGIFRNNDLRLFRDGCQRTNIEMVQMPMRNDEEVKRRHAVNQNLSLRENIEQSLLVGVPEDWVHQNPAVLRSEVDRGVPDHLYLHTVFLSMRGTMCEANRAPSAPWR